MRLRVRGVDPWKAGSIRHLGWDCRKDQSSARHLTGRDVWRVRVIYKLEDVWALGFGHPSVGQAQSGRQYLKPECLTWPFLTLSLTVLRRRIDVRNQPDTFLPKS